MTLAQVVGALLVASPFVALAVFIVKELGWVELLLIFGGIAGLVWILWAGLVLLGVS